MENTSTPVPPSHVFVDESKTRDYVLVAALVPPPALGVARSVIGGLRLPGQRRFHMKHERDSRKRLMLSELTRLGTHALAIIASRESRPEHVCRQMCLETLVPRLAARGDPFLCLESDESQDRRDRKVLSTLVRHHACAPGFTFRHDRAASEPLLAIPDALAWACAKGGEWRRRAQPMIVDTIRV